MNKIYNIMTPLNNKNIIPGTVLKIDSCISLSRGTIITGIVYDGTKSIPTPIDNTPVILIEIINFRTYTKKTIVGEVFTDSDGFYILSLSRVKSYANYTIKTTINDF